MYYIFNWSLLRVVWTFELAITFVQIRPTLLPMECPEKDIHRYIFFWINPCGQGIVWNFYLAITFVQINFFIYFPHHMSNISVVFKCAKNY